MRVVVRGTSGPELYDTFEVAMRQPDFGVQQIGWILSVLNVSPELSRHWTGRPTFSACPRSFALSGRQSDRNNSFHKAGRNLTASEARKRRLAPAKEWESRHSRQV